MADELEQLMWLKELTAKSGALHEAQVLQLKYWPLIVTNAVESEFTFAFEEKTVIFNLLKLKGKTPKNIQKRFEALEGWVKDLLGKEYSVFIQHNGLAVYPKVKSGKRRRNK